MRANGLNWITSMAKPIVHLAIASVVCSCILTEAHCATPGGGESELPAIVHPDATEIRCPFPILIAGTEEPLVLDLGQLRTGTPHYVRVEYVNMIGKPIKISEVVSTCGCMVAAKSAETVESFKKAFFVLALKTELKETRLRKPIYVSFEGGPKVAILVTAQFIAPFELILSSPTFQGSADETFELRLRAKSPNFPFSDVQVRSATGSIRISKSHHIPEDNLLASILELNSETRRQLRASGFVTEVLYVDSTKSGKALCQLPLTLNSGYKYLCRPSLVRFSKDSEGWSARVLVAGDWSQETGFEALKLTSAGHDVRDASVVVSHRTNNVARLEIQITKALLNEKPTQLAIDRLNGERLCVIENVRFEE